MVVVKGEAGLDLLSRKFRSAADRMEGPAFLKDLADAVRADALEGFRNSTDPAGLPWRACVYRGGPPLVVSERLMRAASGGPGHYEVLGFRAVVLGVDGSVVPYAAAHQFGADQTRPERRR